ncbi:putative RNA-binding protein [Escovopsis weberi]|uniref:Putative RNA-binding protein n=1 Tax=Escovopsis weberi TaxID=150374 RepID=A0A0M8N1R2_ESCWE|nr:putative RNA-binding protein [Escovopsis weberi]
MLFPEEDAPLLKTWIVKRIENTSDADSDVLADYVIALLKHDGNADSVRKLCEAEIPDFLTEEPKAFLDDVFQAIAYKSYRPGAPPAPKPFAPPAPQLDALHPPAPASRKRALQDMAEPETAGDLEQSANAGGRFRQAKRGRRGRMDVGAGGGSSRQGFAPRMGVPPFDPNNPLDMLLQMRAMGIPIPGMPDFGAHAFPPVGARGQARRRARCRDFDTKGYCSRGNTCTYDHGNDSIYVPSVQSMGEDPCKRAPTYELGTEYDPSNAALPLSHATALVGMNPFDPFMAGMLRGHRPGRGGHGGKGGARASFSAEGPVHDRSKSTIVVENIPEESFSEDEVRGFFTQFGQVLQVSMQPYKHLAIVKFDHWGAANAAYRSPKVIFDNRFVKVFWYKGPEDELPPSHTAGATTNAANAANGAPRPHPELLAGAPGAEADLALDTMDLDEFHRKQEEAQRQHQEREAKRSEIERQRQDLERQQHELLAKHRLESERLRERLGGKNGGSDGGPQTHEASATDKLRAQLAELEREARILGIDPDAADDDGAAYSAAAAAAARGGGYRGRGARGGRGAPFVRGRGALRGGHAGRHAAYAQYSIDNRPKRLSVTGVDFTPADKDEQLRHFLLNLGEFESVETSPSVTHVSFQDRKTAEKFFHSLNGKELPGVPGRLELSWAEGGGAPSSSSSSAAAAAAGPAKTAGMPEDTGDAMAGMDDLQDAGAQEEEEEQQQQQQQPRASERQVDMDYEVAEDEGWGE